MLPTKRHESFLDDHQTIHKSHKTKDKRQKHDLFCQCKSYKIMGKTKSSKSKRTKKSRRGTNNGENKSSKNKKPKSALSSFGLILLKFGFTWLFIVLITKLFHLGNDTISSSKSDALDSSSGEDGENRENMGDLDYSEEDGEKTQKPLMLGTGESFSFHTVDHKQFHPVVKFPEIWVDNDDTTEQSEHGSEDDSSEEFQFDDELFDDEPSKKKKSNKRRKKKKKKVLNYTVKDFSVKPAEEQKDESHPDVEYCEGSKAKQFFRKRILRKKCIPPTLFHVGKYNEDRKLSNLYTTPLFQNFSNAVDGYDGKRTIHTGIDLFGPVSTKVYAFASGRIHSVGYNEAHGDYGNVIVIEHEITLTPQLTLDSNRKQPKERTKIWALYGHLSHKSIFGKKAGQKVKKGKVIGFMGSVEENGGWPMPHVHFQLSISPPETHDMPGVVSKRDIEKALVDYPDPRIVLGPLY